VNKLDSLECAVQHEIKSFMESHNIPGLQLAILSGNSLRLSQGFGLADIENNLQVQRNTSFRIASISKPITACAILSLCNQDLLKLHDPVTKYVAGLPKQFDAITIHQLLTHTSGIRGYRDNAEVEQIQPCRSLREGVGIFVESPLMHTPGSNFLYSTFGYTLLGLVAESVSVLSFAEILEKDIFRLANMSKTKIDNPQEIVPFRARGYFLNDEGKLSNSKFVCNSYKIPGGGLISVADDLLNFATSLLENRILPKDTVQEMCRSHFSVNSNGAGVGYGWTIVEHNTFREVFHTGEQHQVSTILYLTPKEHFFVAILANLESVPTLTLARKLREITREADC